MALLLASCGRLGMGIPECEPVAKNPSGAMILSVQAVPTAEYAPCINSLQLGWDNLDFDVESGRASFSISRAIEPFFTATLTETCDIGDATRVSHPLVEKYESIHSVGSDIEVTIIPSGERPFFYAETLAEDLTGVRVDGRPVVFTVVPASTSATVRIRVERALMTSQFVWIIGELDVNEGTLELRRTSEGEGDRGMSTDEAMQRMEELAPEVVYEGNWYFVFEGGCITYEFDARGTVAETIADDVTASLGLYPLAELRKLGSKEGFEVIAPVDG
jgi:hypothetical protein